MVRKSSKTHKRRKASTAKASSMSAMGIPELRKSIDYIGDYTQSLVASGSKVTREMASDFAAEWRKVFGKTMPLESAKEYLESVLKTSKGPKRTKHTRKHMRGTMRGGAQDTTLTGAPMAHLTRPGVDIPYGQFLPYVNKGFWNPEQAPAADCGTFKPVLPMAGTGSNSMKGGGFMSAISNAFSATSFRPFVATNPTTPQFDAQTAWKGQQLGPGPEAWQQAWKPMSSASAISIPSVGSYVRDVAADVQTK